MSNDPDFTIICKHCGCPFLDLWAQTCNATQGGEKYVFRFVGAKCPVCHTAKYSLDGRQKDGDARHCRWWYFGKEYEDNGGRPFAWCEKRWRRVSAFLLTDPKRARTRMEESKQKFEYRYPSPVDLTAINAKPVKG